jgi:hypothetical protein
LRRLGDATSSVWTQDEIDRYLTQGHLELAHTGRVFWDQVFLENLPPGFSYTASWEQAEAGLDYGVANYTCSDERRMLDEFNRVGYATHTCPDEATDGWLASCLASVAIPSMAELPTTLVDLERATWDFNTLVALTPTQLAQTDTRYQVTAGEVFAFTWRQDGLRSFRKIRVPAAQAASHRCEGSCGILRTPTDISGETTRSTRGIPRCIPTQHPIGTNLWGLPRRVYRDGTNVKVEYWREGRLLSDVQGSELPARYAYYLRDYAIARALARNGPGQDNVLAAHYWERWMRGLARVVRRKMLVNRPRTGQWQPVRVLGGTRPPRPRLPWPYPQRGR